jgi:hypothetical protein
MNPSRHPRLRQLLRFVDQAHIQQHLHSPTRCTLQCTEHPRVRETGVLADVHGIELGLPECRKVQLLLRHDLKRKCTSMIGIVLPAVPLIIAGPVLFGSRAMYRNHSGLDKSSMLFVRYGACHCRVVIGDVRCHQHARSRGVDVP